MIICKNCGNEFEGNYCPGCGQKADIHKFTIRHALHEFAHTFTHVDSGILFLIKEMFLRPGTVAKEYIAGKRKKYFSPMQYLILTVAVSTFLSVKFSLMGPGAGNISPEMYEHLSETAKMGIGFNQFIYSHFNLILFIAVPVMALFSWLFYKKSGYNYSENLIFHSFLGAQRTLIYLLMAPFLYFFRELWYIFIGIYYLGWIVYFGWAFTQFFVQKKSTVIAKYIIMILIFLPVMQGVSWGIFYLFFYKK